MRLHRLLLDAIRKAGGRVLDGLEVISADFAGERVTRVWTEAAGRPQPHQAQTFILASGGVLGGGLRGEIDGQLRETVFGLPINAPPNRLIWFEGQFLHPEGHSVFQAGLQTQANFQIAYPNLYAAGDVLAGDFIHQRSLEGVALVSAYQIGEVLA